MDNMVLKPPPDPRMRAARNKRVLARRLNSLEAKHPQFADRWRMFPFRRPEDLARYEEGLRKAGLPE
jgi:hypothetical protein